MVHWEVSEEDLEKCTMNPIEEPQFDDYFAKVISHIKENHGGFPGGAVVENLPAGAGDTGSSPGLGRSHMPRSN